MNKILAAALLLWAALPSWGQSVKLPAEVRSLPGTSLAIVVPESKDGGEVKWIVGPGLSRIPLELLFPGQKSAGLIVAGSTGRYEVWAYNAKGDVASELAKAVVVIGDAPPVPPIPPGPLPPVPPVPPGPTPGPAPIPAAGFRVLLVFESRESLTAAQAAVLQSGTIREYLNSKCVKEGQQPEWRLWDKDVNTQFESKVWQDAMARKRDKLPWIVISTGKAGFEGPLPPTVGELIALLKSYAEPTASVNEKIEPLRARIATMRASAARETNIARQAKLLAEVEQLSQELLKQLSTRLDD